MIIASKKETFRILEEYNLIAKKRYGQNFLVNYETIKKIVDGCDINHKTLVIEIGPGLGALTQELLNVSNHVIAMEIDKNMIKVLKDNFGFFNNLTIINTDFLKIDLDDLIDKYKGYEEVVIVSNLPYYITSDILEKIISNKNPKIKRIVAMMQKEVGKKILKKESYIESYLKALIDNYCEVNTVMHVSKNDFEPRPNVDSIVLEFLLKKSKYQLDYYFFEIIKECLKNRRKTLINALPYSDKEKICSVLEQLNLKTSIRIEEITIEQLNAVIERMK